MESINPNLDPDLVPISPAFVAVNSPLNEDNSAAQLATRNPYHPAYKPAQDADGVIASDDPAEYRRFLSDEERKHRAGFTGRKALGPGP